MKAMIFDVQRLSFVDGPGIRTTVFFKGCNLKCTWCHNPESQEFYKQLLVYKDKCTDCGKCKKVCPYRFEKCDACGKCVVSCMNDAREICGTEMSTEEVLAEIIKDRVFYESSGGGVTFSGGECMLQVDFLAEILRMCKENNIQTAVDTAGNVPWENFLKIIPYTDLFLYDIKSMDTQKHKKYTGVGNERILENLAKLLKQKEAVRVRVPVISGINDTIEEMEAIKGFYKKVGFPERTELLQYHTLGKNKYCALNRDMEKFEIPSKELIDKLYMELT